jgi:hypothetical protein
VVSGSEPLEETFEQKSEGLSQSINLRINVLVGDQAAPVQATVIREHVSGQSDH